MTINACKLCSPLGACLAFRGVQGAVPFLHGSQGCATYIRRYFISHFREPIDIASSSFTEESAVFGGGHNLRIGLENVITQYKPSLIGVATTCLSETIGDDVSLLVNQFRQDWAGKDVPILVTVSTPSYRGTHLDGFRQTLKALVDSLATKKGDCPTRLNVLGGFISCADIRYLKEIVQDFGFSYSLLPDYSETLDAPLRNVYQRIPEGGTPLVDIVSMGDACATVEFGRTLAENESAGDVLRQKFKVPLYKIGLPIGIKETDAFFRILQEISGHPLPQKYELERGRLIDSYIDGHKYVFSQRAIVFGDEDLVIGLASFLAEIGVVPVLCASGSKSGRLKEAIKAVVSAKLYREIEVAEGVDFMDMAQAAEKLSADFLIGNSKGYFLTRKLNIPLVRVGFPIHDRIGSQRILHLGYRGAQQLFDRLVNALIEKKQDSCSVGYSYV